MKIVRTYTIAPVSLHKLAEAGFFEEEGNFLDSLKNSMGDLFAKKKPAAQPQAAGAQKKEPPDVARSTEKSEQDAPLSHVITSITHPLTHGQQRVVLHLGRAELTDLFLKDDDASHLRLAKALLGVKESFKLISSLVEADPGTGEPDEEPPPEDVPKGPAGQGKATTVKQPTATPRVVKMPQGYKFSALLQGKEPDTVLLDVPNQLWDRFESAADPAEKAAALADMMHPKYYTLTISKANAKPIAKFMDRAGDNFEAQAAAFNPGIVVQNPRKQTMQNARTEWNEQFSQKHAQLTGAKPAAQAAEQPAPAAQPTEEPFAQAKLPELYEPLIAYAKKYRKTDPHLQKLLAQVALKIKAGSPA